jgi:hypothetical protein
MLTLVQLFIALISNCFKSPRRLEVENLYLRHQLNIAMRHAPRRFQLRDRALMVWMTRRWPNLLTLSRVVRPDTILRWHRAGFRAYWRWKSRGQPGRPKVDRELRDLIRQMCKQNPLLGGSTHSWRITQAWLRTCRVDGLRVHDPAPRTTVAILADIPAQSRRRDRSD